MKPFLVCAAALLLPSLALAQSSGAMPNMPVMAEGARVTADGTGVVMAIDANAGAVTIHHGPIATLNWPAMTMPFKASSPSILQGVHVGQRVGFKLMQMGGQVTLTEIHAR